MTTTSKKSVPLNGWDLAYATDFAHANKVIADSGVSPKKFSFLLEDDQFYEICGDYDEPWKLDYSQEVEGGKACFFISMKNAEYREWRKDEGRPGNPKYKYDVCFYVIIKLTWIEDIEVKEVHHLKIDQTDDDVSIISAKVTPASGTIISKKDEAWIGETLPQLCFLEDVQDFDHIFTTLDYTQEITPQEKDQDKFSWLKPTSHTYSISLVKEKKENDYVTTGGVLFVLCMVQNNEPPSSNLAPENFIPEGSMAAFAFNQSLVLKNILWNSLHDLVDLEGNSLEYYFTINDKLISNKNIVKLKKMKNSGGDLVQPELEIGNFTIEIIDGYISFELLNANYIFIKDRWKAFFHVSNRHSLELNENLKFGMVADTASKPIFSHYLTPIDHKTDFKEIISYIGNILLDITIAIAAGYVAGRVSERYKPSSSGTEDIPDPHKAPDPESEREAQTGDAESIAEQQRRLIEEGESTGEPMLDGTDFDEAVADDIADRLGDGSGESKPSEFKKFLGTTMGELALMSIFQMLLTKEEDFYKWLWNWRKQKQAPINTLDAILDMSMVSLTWPNAKDFKVKSGGLEDGAFLIGLDFTYEQQSSDGKKI